MKLIVFAPMADMSAIGRVATRVTSALVSAGHEVVMVSTDLHEPVDAHRPPCEVLHWTDSDRVVAAVLSADVATYHIGDNYALHAGAVEWSTHVPGIVCLHDFFLGNLYVGWCRHTGRSVADAVAEWYGAEAAVAYEHAMYRPDFIGATLGQPMTEWIAARADAVVTHSRWGLPHVERACPGPICVTDLPYEPIVGVEAPRVRSAAASFELLTVGHVNANKHVDSVIKAIGSSDELRDRIIYTVAGTASRHAVDTLGRLASDRGVRFVTLGAVDDHALETAYRAADGVVALRSPCLEAASASAIEAMLAGRPLIVADDGWYGELPDDVVLKVGGVDDVAQIRAALERLVFDPAGARQLAERAYLRAGAVYRFDRYAADLVAVAHQALLAAPALNTARAAVAQLRAWGTSVEQVDADVLGRMLDLAGRPVLRSSFAG